MKLRFCLLALCTALLCAGSARADGPHIAFHATEGAYTATLFSAPDPLVAGPVDLALLVQTADGSTATDLRSLCGELTLAGREPIAFTFASGAGGNSRLPGATVRLPAPGTYALTLEVFAGSGAPVRFLGALPVAPDNGKRNTVLWAVFLALAVIFLFLANQYGKQKLAKARLQGAKRTS